VYENILYGIDGYFDEDLKLLDGAVDFRALDSESLDLLKLSDRVQSKVTNAAVAANAHAFITNFQHGYDTNIGEGGKALSGGQKQRIAIARAIVKRPILLLLDEATSALDSTSERVVQASIDHLREANSELTTICVAHRLSAIRQAYNNASRRINRRDGKA
jgi:ABC-type multidrug transport system fused ATPase/permease subunit